MTHAVVAENLSKLYRLGEYRAAYGTLRDTLASGMRRATGRAGPKDDEFMLWALKDVSFEIDTGEVVGFIGRNGAGKSTLLKVLTRITPPTAGTATIRGRVGSILEVGTGFHPELTGRENVMLNGAVLGMRRPEINRRFDDIVEFSGVEQFIDTPVKRYSSGMYVRLAFAVAAHLEPEVLIIDEVLAVGDYEFQRRCMGRIEEISQSGRTVLFVSHDMQAVTRLCDRVYWLESGRVVGAGESEDVVAEYLRGRSGGGSVTRFTPGNEPGTERGRLHGIRVVDANGESTASVDVREPVGIEFDWTLGDAGDLHPFPKIKVIDERGTVVFNALDTSPRWREGAEPGRYRSTAWIPGNLLNEGYLSVDATIVALAGPKFTTIVNLPGAVSFHVHDPGAGDSSRGLFTGSLQGAVRPLLDWTCEPGGLDGDGLAATSARTEQRRPAS